MRKRRKNMMIEEMEYIRKFSTPENWKTDTQLSKEVGIPCNNISAYRRTNNLLKMGFKPRNCIECGKPIKNPVPNQKYCEDCGIKVRRRRQRTSKRHRIINPLFPQKGIDWADSEDETIRKYWKTKSDAEIGIMLDRTEQSIQYRRYKILKLSRSPEEWTKKEDEFLKENYLIKTDFDLSEMLGRTTKGVQARRSNLGLVKGNEYRRRKRWDREEFKRDFLKAKSREELIRKYGLPWRVLVERARVLKREGFKVDPKKFRINKHRKERVHINFSVRGEMAEFLSQKPKIADYIRKLIEEDMRKNE